MNTEQDEYFKKVNKLILKNFDIMMQLLASIDINTYGVMNDTIPTLNAVRDIFIEAIIQNIDNFFRTRIANKIINIDKDFLVVESKEKKPKKPEKKSNRLYI